MQRLLALPAHLAPVVLDDFVCEVQGRIVEAQIEGLDVRGDTRQAGRNGDGGLAGLGTGVGGLEGVEAGGDVAGWAGGGINV